MIKKKIDNKIKYIYIFPILLIFIFINYNNFFILKKK